MFSSLLPWSCCCLKRLIHVSATEKRRREQIPGRIKNAFSPQKSIMSHCLEDGRQRHRLRFIPSFFSMNALRCSGFSRPLGPLRAPFNRGLCSFNPLYPKPKIKTVLKMEKFSHFIVYCQFITSV